MRFGVLGAGSLGSLLAGRLAVAGDEVAVLGRANEHLERIQSDGLVLQTPDGDEVVATPTAVSSDPVVLDGVDVLLVAVKSYDTDQAITVAEPHITPQTDVLTLQNGLGNPETIARHVPDARVVAGTTTHGATLDAPGRVRHAGGGDTRIGRYFADNDPVVEEIASAFTAAGIETDVVDDVRDAVWEKVLVNVGINAATALARVPNGALTEGPGARVLSSAVREGARVAEADGRTVPDDIVDRARKVAERTATNHSSMRQDLDSGRRTEIDALNGELVRRAEDLGIRTPVNRTLADLVRLASGTD